MSDLALTGLEGKVAVVTGAGRMRSIGRPIAVELARAGCDVVLTGTGRPPDQYPDDEKEAGWRDIDAVADEIRALGPPRAPRGERRVRRRGGRRARATGGRRAGPRRHRGQQCRRRARPRSCARRRSRPRCVAPRDRRQPPRHLLHEPHVRPSSGRAGRRRQHRQHLVGRGEDAGGAHRGLFGVEGGDPRVDVRDGAGARARRDPRERGVPGDHRHVPHGRRRPRRGAGTA